METETTTQATKPRSTIIAIVVSIIAILLGAYSLFSSIQNESQTAQLQTSVTTLSQNQLHHAHTFQQTLSQLQTSQPLQSQKIIAELNYLTTVANTQLMVLHDRQAALQTTGIMQNILENSNNTNADSLNQALQSDIVAIRAVPVVHTTQLFSDLSDLIQKIQTLSSLPGAPDVSLQKTINAMKASDDSQKKWYERCWDSIKELKSLIIIRHVDASRAPLLEPNLEAHLKQNITTQLMMAQWALLHHDENVYQIALKNAQQWITQYFVLTDAKNLVITELSQLMQTQINPTLPTLDHLTAALSQINTQKPVVSTPTPPPTTTTKPTPPVPPTAATPSDVEA